jgi:hypothetical protein
MGQSFSGIQYGASNLKDPSAALESARTAGQQTEQARKTPQSSLFDYMLPSRANNYSAGNMQKVSGNKGSYWEGFFRRLSSGEEIDLSY